MRELIVSNVWSIMFIGLTIIILAIAYKKGKKDEVKKIIYSLVVQAEKALGSGTGDLKYATVINTFYLKIPYMFRIMFSKKDLDMYIEEALVILKLALVNEESM